MLSAWDAGTASAGLRPKPTAAMLVVSVDRSEQDVVRYDQPQIESLVSRQITTPVLLPAAAAVLGRFGWWPTPPALRSHESDSTQPSEPQAPLHEIPVAH